MALSNEMIKVSLRTGPYETAEAVVEPYSCFGEFLTVEGSWAWHELAAVAEAIRRGEIQEFRRSGNAHSVHFSHNSVRIESVYSDPPWEVVLPLTDFIAGVEQWKTCSPRLDRRWLWPHRLRCQV
jgi:hypothetical protein